MSQTPPRRKRGAVRLNCAECRRLKIRCDRTVPCSSCLKRGCSAICPDGSLTTGQRNRYVITSTEDLQERNLELVWRIRCLEDALRTLHSERSPDIHPLLSENLLEIKIPFQRDPLPFQDSIPESLDRDASPDIGKTFASLSCQVSGESRYYGHPASSWLFLRNAMGESGEDSDEPVTPKLDLPPDILRRSAAVSLSSLKTGSFGYSHIGINDLLPYLPSQPIADALRTVYYTHASWMYNPVPSEQFEAHVYSDFYGTCNLTRGKQLYQKLSVLFLVLAIGSLMDTTLPPYNIEAERYHQLARAALFQTSLFDAPSLQTVQALFLMSFYQFLTDRHGASSDASWVLMGMAVRVSQTIGLHRDGTLWGFDAVAVQNRRVLFWEIFTYDSWQSLTFGRPTSFPLTHVDCEQPYTTEDVPDDEAFHVWKHCFTFDCMSVLHDRAFGARGLNYSAVLQLDEKIRNFPVPPVLGMSHSIPSQTGLSTAMALALQRHIVVAMREINILYLHRSFFTRAICDYPEDPLGSPYGNSVHAVFRSAQSLMAMMRSLHTQFRGSCERMWFLWTHIFSCSIILASIVTRCPSINLAPSALYQLDVACKLFSDVAAGFRATEMLDVMLKLQRKAHRSLKDHQGGITVMTSSDHYCPPGSGPPGMGSTGEELTMLKGNTREGPISTPISTPIPTPFTTPIPTPSPEPEVSTLLLPPSTGRLRNHMRHESIDAQESYTECSTSSSMCTPEVEVSLPLDAPGDTTERMIFPHLASVPTIQRSDGASFIGLEVPLQLRHEFDQQMISHMDSEVVTCETSDDLNYDEYGFDLSAGVASFPQYLNAPDYNYGSDSSPRWPKTASRSAVPALASVGLYVVDNNLPVDECPMWQDLAPNLRSF